MNLLIQGATLYQAGRLSRQDVLIKGGKIAQIAPAINPEGVRTIAAAGMLLSPGFTDLHVHLRQPGFEQKETIATGTAAAAAGGFTTVCPMPNLNPVPDSVPNLAPQLAAIQANAGVRVLPYGALTAGEEGLHLAHISALAPAVAGFSDDGRGVQSEDIMRSGMAAVAEAGSFIAAHCEDEALLPAGGTCVQENSAFALAQGYTGYSNRSEWAEVERDIRLVEERMEKGQTPCRLHICHASTAHTFHLVRQAKAKGLPVTCEVTPHNLLLSCNNISENDGRFKMNPPLRTPADVAAARTALADGTVDAIATDHAPHTPQEKAGGFARAANGVVGLETAFPVLYTQLVLPGLLPMEQLLKLLTTGPLGVLGEAPNEVCAGQPADLTLLALDEERAVHPPAFLTKGRATPFAGWKLRGWPVLTLCRGSLAYDAF